MTMEDKYARSTKYAAIRQGGLDVGCWGFWGRCRGLHRGTTRAETKRCRIQRFCNGTIPGGFGSFHEVLRSLTLACGTECSELLVTYHSEFCCSAVIWKMQDPLEYGQNSTDDAKTSQQDKYSFTAEICRRKRTT